VDGLEGPHSVSVLERAGRGRYRSAVPQVVGWPRSNSAGASSLGYSLGRRHPSGVDWNGAYERRRGRGCGTLIMDRLRSGETSGYQDRSQSA